MFPKKFSEEVKKEIKEEQNSKMMTCVNFPTLFLKIGSLFQKLKFHFRNSYKGFLRNQI